MDLVKSSDAPDPLLDGCGRSGEPIVNSGGGIVRPYRSSEATSMRLCVLP